MHSFNPEHARKYGIAEAILISYFQFWILTNKGNRHNFHDGRTWTYITRDALALCYPYLTAHQIRYAIDKLVKAGVLLKGHYSKDRYKRTTWYSFANEALWLSKEALAKNPKCIGENQPMEGGIVPNASGKGHQSLTLSTALTTTVPTSSKAEDATSGEGKSADPPPTADLLVKAIEGAINRGCGPIRVLAGRDPEAFEDEYEDGEGDDDGGD